MASLLLMGAITLWAQQYQQGLITLEDLTANLEAFEWKVPARFVTMPKDIFEADAQAEERTYADEDTMDELLSARDTGLLTREDLDKIMGALDGVD